MSYFVHIFTGNQIITTGLADGLYCPYKGLLPTSACKRTEPLSLVALTPLPVNRLLLLLFVYNSCEIFAVNSHMYLSMVAQLFLSSSWELFYLKIKLFGSTSIAGDSLADTKKNTRNHTISGVHLASQSQKISAKKCT